jgi:cytoskeletal protein RodZ
MDPVQSQVPVESKKSFGPIIGIVVIVILLIVGALYFWGAKLSNTSEESAVMNSTSNSAAAVQSDETESIENDLETSGSAEIDLTGLDTIE